MKRADGFAAAGPPPPPPEAEPRRGTLEQLPPLPADSPYREEPLAAAYLRIQPKTLANKRLDGTGPRYRKHGGRIVYHVRDLDAWSNEHAFTSTSEETARAAAQAGAAPAQ